MTIHRFDDRLDVSSPSPARDARRRQHFHAAKQGGLRSQNNAFAYQSPSTVDDDGGSAIGRPTRSRNFFVPRTVYTDYSPTNAASSSVHASSSARMRRRSDSAFASDAMHSTSSSKAPVRPVRTTPARLPSARAIRRLGHSVETLVSTYVGALDDEEHVANQRVDTILG